MAAFLYRCPTTGLRVQGWLADNPAQHSEHYELVNCLACGGRHLVNMATGKTLAEEDEVEVKRSPLPAGQVRQ